PVQYTYQKVFDFVDSLNGKSPKARFILAADGLLYGTASSGGSNHSGVLFSYNSANQQFTKLLDFIDSSMGSHPKATLLEGSDGALYGVTEKGGTYNYGTIFRYDPEALS